MLIYILIFSCRAHGAPFFIGVLIPFLVLYLFNWIIFLIVVISLILKKISSKAEENDSKKDSGQDSFHSSIKNRLMITMTRSVLFGLSWGLGLLITEDAHSNKISHDLFISIFVILTALHGLFIFIMYFLLRVIKRVHSGIKENEFHLYALTHSHETSSSIKGAAINYPNQYLETKLSDANLNINPFNTG